MLQVAGIGKSFGGVTALRGVSFELAAGEVVGIMGANGAGKTTLFSLIAGNGRPTAGEIRLDGRRIDGLRPDRINRLGIARTFQIVRPFANLTVLENVMVGALFGRGGLEARERAEAIIADVGLSDRRLALASELTIAGLKRLEVARALATTPRLLMLDEVMAGLTPTEVGQAIELIQRLAAAHGLTLLIVEHVMKALMRMCGRIVVLHQGAVLAIGTPAEIAVNPEVIRVYFGARA